MEFSEKIKNFLIAGFSLAIIIIFTFFWLYKPQKTFIYPQKKPTKEAKRTARSFIETSGPKPVYNYNHMLLFLKEFRKIELRFYSNFDEFVSNPENINKMQNTLNNLKTEKELYNQHIQKMNIYYKRSTSYKRINTLRYYLRSVDRAIHDLENFIKKIKLNKA